MQRFHSHGKLLISGEYVVLDGATALALPTRPGQSMDVKEFDEPVIKWESRDADGSTWFEETFQISELRSALDSSILAPQDFTRKPKEEVSKMLFLTLLSAARQNPELLSGKKGFDIVAITEFPRHWGLGTSSTLIANISKWLNIDAFKLLQDTFGGSGFDVAVALYSGPITFEKYEDQNSILRTSFDPPFKAQLFFVHLNQKQNSRESIKHYREQKKETLETAVEKISSITHRIITCTEISEFNLLLEIHENIISQLTGLQKVKSKLFPDYPGAVKSLGGWGGDFILATGSEESMDYFRQKGYSSILPYSDLILS